MTPPPTVMNRPPTSYVASPPPQSASLQTPPPSAQAPVRVRVWVSDPARAVELRDYFRRLGLCALAGDGGTVEAECPPGSDPRRTREEIDGYIDGWVKTNRVPVQLT
jgi:hypothetical protein